MNKDIAIFRKKWHDMTSKQEYAKIINPKCKKNNRFIMKVRFDTLQNMQRNFALPLAYYHDSCSKKEKEKLLSVLSQERILEILQSHKSGDSSKYITIPEIFKLYQKLNLKKDLIHYFSSKTHLSFSVFQNQEPMAQMGFLNKNVEEAMKKKLSEFIHVILSEYMMLHNFMWVSSCKLKEVKSIDTWMKSI